MILDFKNFYENLIVENLHPELQAIVNSRTSRKSKQTQLANTIKSITARGESTGIEGNMPKGSSRAYLAHSTPENIVVDNTPTTIKTGTKVAIRAQLDPHHNKADFDGLSLGALQNKAENGDHWVNSTYRTLRQDSVNKEHFTTNSEGIFPPLINHDSENHEWAHVGHVSDINDKTFRKLTKTPEFPQGISHEEFHQALSREYNKNIGRYWAGLPHHEERMEQVLNHPLVQKFNDYHGNTGNPPLDYGQLQNLGIWTHPVSGKQSIVARDHGYSTDVADAYKQARAKKFRKW